MCDSCDFGDDFDYVERSVLIQLILCVCVFSDLGWDVCDSGEVGYECWDFGKNSCDFLWWAGFL